MQDQETREHRSTEATRRKRWILVSVLVVLGVAVMIFSARFAANFAAGDPWNVQPGIEVEVTIAPGTSASAIYQVLDDAKVARSSEVRDAARSAGVEDQLRAGTYVFVTDMDPDAVVRELLLGGDADGGSFTLIEGWTIDRILDELADQTDYTRDEFQAALVSGAVTSAMLPEVSGDITSLSRWEGLLYPAKYPIGGDATPVSMLTQMADEMVTRTAGIDWSRIEELGISRYEALIIASLIEREAGIDEDRPIISSVIHNRLNIDMRLQIDATVVYALGGVDGQVTAEDLKIESAYNTYRIDGLPPTPIGTVRDLSLQAAALPSTTNFLFYVLASKDGSHAFAETYEDHQSNVEAAKKAGVLP
ncbi:MAG: endolytic transglycosylase MltG [Acidimicrobiia bacterium]